MSVMAGPLPPDAQGVGARWEWPSIHPDGRKFVVAAALIALIALWLFWPIIAWPLVAIAVWTAAFFRDPVRHIPQGSDLIVAPADGLVSHIRTMIPPMELISDGGLPSAYCTRVSIFMSVFDVHINRAPITGSINLVSHIDGHFRNAADPEAGEVNERQHLVLMRGDGLRVGVTQVAGLLARRIVGFVKPGDTVAAGQRIGLIRFGSRVDVWLPNGIAPRVALGQRCIAGETILAHVGEPVAASAIAL